jgi:hypothetical protein
LPLTLGIDPAVIPHQYRACYNTRANETQLKGMAEHVTGRIFGSIKV